MTVVELDADCVHSRKFIGPERLLSRTDGDRVDKDGGAPLLSRVQGGKERLRSVGGGGRGVQDGREGNAQSCPAIGEMPLGVRMLDILSSYGP